MIQALPLFHIGPISEKMGNLQGLSREFYRNKIEPDSKAAGDDFSRSWVKRSRRLRQENHGFNPLF